MRADSAVYAKEVACGPAERDLGFVIGARLVGAVALTYAFGDIDP